MHSARPASQHRLSMSSQSGSLPRQSHARTHSHSVSTGSLIPSHRVTRRKSVSSNSASSVAAVRAAVRDGDMIGIPVSRRTKNTSTRIAGSLPSPPPSLASHRYRMASMGRMEGESAIDDQADDMEEDEDSSFKQARNRRASEGQHIISGDKKASGDLKCDKCGKGYKHSSCLSKHLFVPTSFPARFLWFTWVG